MHDYLRAVGFSKVQHKRDLQRLLDMDVFIQELLKEGDYVLSQTPEMLPVLKQAGVVDSGGQGLMQVLKGAYDGYLGKEITFTAEKPAMQI